MTYSWTFAPLLQYSHLWGEGLLRTILLTAIVIPSGTALAIPIVMAGRSAHAAPRVISRLCSDVLRSLPALVLLVTLFFVLPILFSYRISAFQTAVIALSLNLAPFVAECIRGAIDSVPNIQYDSARVLGLDGWELQYYVIGPQIVRRLLPALMGQYITTLKLTSLVATIGVQELWNVTGQITTQTVLPIEARLAGASLYLVIVLPLVYFSSWLERRFGVAGLGGLRDR